MNYSGNMPDWHQYNPPQGGRTSAPSSGQNANPSHMFISNLSPPSIEGINLSSDRHQSTKSHQNDPAQYPVRNYQSSQITGTNCPTNTSLSSSSLHMTPLSSSVNHYANSSSTRNAMIESLNNTMDPRMTSSSTVNEDVAHRNNQIPFLPPTNHQNSTNINSNPPPGMHSSTIVSQNSPVGSMSPNRQAPTYGTCKGPCCISDPNIPYQHWDKFAHYPGTPNVPQSTYRDNIRQTVYSQPIDSRRFLSDMNLRKDCIENKDLVEPPTPYSVEHRRNFTDYKYARKDNLLSRNYPPPTNNLIQNYPMQNYNFPTDYQKCPYSVKDYMRRGNNAGSSASSKNSGILKYQEQQKYQHSKMQYQNNGVLPNGLSNVAPGSGNMSSALQSSYFNTSQLSRDVSRDYSRDYQQDQSVVASRIAQASTNSHVHGSFQKYHAYHQKIAMQRFTLENHLRAFTRVPGYQSHPKYQECVMQYREILRLQQTVDYQNVIQESPKISSPNAGPIAPINLQFDQNGVLVNSNYIPSTYPGIHGNVNPMTTSVENSASSENNRTSGIVETQNRSIDHTDQSMNLTRDIGNSQLQHQNSESVNENSERYFITDGKNDGENERLDVNNENLDSRNIDVVDSIETTKNTGQNDTTIATSIMTEAESPAMQNNNSKEFADKPEIDVRQFLANWDESEDEENTTNISSQVLDDSNVIGEQFDAAVFSNERDVSTNLQSKDESTVGIIEGSSSVEANSTDDCLNTAAMKECIRTTDEVDEIPTIHIVESLEDGTDMEKIRTVFGSLTTSVLNPISIGERLTENGAKGETIVLFEDENGVCTKALEFSVSSKVNNTDVVEGVIASIIESSPVLDESKTMVENEENSYIEQSNDELTKVAESTGTIVTSTSPESTYSTVTTTNSVSSSATPSLKTNTESDDSLNLRKQNSFTSDESHNPDDISLPDLQTSECTPISTTLNTPIHSDSEESSERVADLTISTNPIEIIQNSPIISFTHSPIKIEPYEQLENSRIRGGQSRQNEHDSLDFDFIPDDNCSQNRKYENLVTSSKSVAEELENDVESRRNSMLMGDIRESESRDVFDEKSRTDSEQEEEFYRTADPLVGMTQNPKSVSKEHRSCTKTTEESEACRQESNGGENNRQRCDSSPVDRTMTSDELDIDRQSIMERHEDFNRSDDLEKLCDMSLDGTCMISLISGENCTEPRLTKDSDNNLPVSDRDNSQPREEKNENPDDDMWTEVPSDTRMDDNFPNSENKKTEDSSTEEKKKKEHSADSNSSNGPENILESHLEENNRSCESNEKSNNSESREKDEVNPSKLKESCASEEPRKSRKSYENERKSEKISNQDRHPKNHSSHHRDPNVEIQVANFNLKIHDNDATRNDSNCSKIKNLDSSTDSVDAIEIKINLSRGDVNRRNNQSQQENLESCSSRKMCCRRRRRSLPDEFETKRMRKNFEDRTEISDRNASKKLGKGRCNVDRQKIRRSMDDALLLNQERIEKRNFHLEMAKTFDLPWPHDESPETENCSTSTRQSDDKKDKKLSHGKCKSDSRTNKHEKELTSLPSPSYNPTTEYSSTLDFDNFDVAPNETSDTDLDQRYDCINPCGYSRVKSRLADRERYTNPSSYGPSYDELASLDAFEINLNTVPIYTTKDGRITYSPNRNYTYRTLIMEARQREGYPAIQKLHYPRNLNLPRSHYRETALRKAYNKRSQEGRSSHEKKRRGSEHYSSKSTKRSSLNQHVDESTESRITMRSKRDEHRRRDTRIATELEYCSDENSSKTHKTETILTSYKPESQKSTERQSEITRKDEEPESNSRNSASSYQKNCTVKNVIDDFAVRETDNSLVSNILHGQELEISLRKVTTDSERIAHSGEVVSGSAEFFHRSLLKISMPSPIKVLDKRPIGWELEQDCQTVLSDSGLESSTTYVEASKESRRFPKWKNSFVNRVENSKTSYSTNRFTQSVDVRLQNDTITRYFDDTAKRNVQMKDEKIQEIQKITATVSEREINETEDVAKDCSSATNSEKIGQCVDLISGQVTENNSENLNCVSEIVKSLDLATVQRHRGLAKDTKDKKIYMSLEKDSAKPEAIFHDTKDATICNVKKISEIYFREASNDAVHVFKSLRTKSSMLCETVDEGAQLFTNEKREPENFDTTTTMSEALERSSNDENFDQPCNDFLIDTSTSFPSCMKQQTPQRRASLEEFKDEDTRTRFAGESMDFKLDNTNLSNSQNFSSFANQSITNSSAIDNDTTDKYSFCSSRNSYEKSKKSCESETSRNCLKESSSEAQILSFSGQIRNDSSQNTFSSKLSESLQKEQSVPKIVIKTNEGSSISASMSCSFDATADSMDQEKEIASRNSEQAMPALRKIPKMIIRNYRSRPATPTPISDDAADVDSSQNFEQRAFAVQIKTDKEARDTSEDCKIPKMKIKLEDKRYENIKVNESCKDSSRNVPKVKIRKIKKSSSSCSPNRTDKYPLVGKLSRQSSETEMQLVFPESAENSSSSYKFTLVGRSTSKQSSQFEDADDNSKQVKIPKLTIKKQESVSNSPSYLLNQSMIKKRRSRSPGETGSKKRRGFCKQETQKNRREDSQSQEKKFNILDNECSTDSVQNLSEKVPKVIIKRTSPSAEFKCELSKNNRDAITKDSKWQPEVKLQRSWVLDSMAKEPRNNKLPLKIFESTQHFDKKTEIVNKNSEFKRTYSDSMCHKIPNFLCKTRRRSDCDVNAPRKDHDEEYKRTLISAPTNRRKSFDENMNTNRLSNFDFTFSKDSTYESSITLKDLDNAKVKEQIDTKSLKKDQDEFHETAKEYQEIQNENLNVNRESEVTISTGRSEKNGESFDDTENFVIKLDSSDESQTTIEILPASPDNSQTELDILVSNMEDCVGNSSMGKLYSDDAIPTQFELELEIVDNSTVDDLDIPMPSRASTHDSDLITNRENNKESYEFYGGCDDREKISNDNDTKNSNEKRDKFSCGGTETNNICCSDSLVKEVLAAKETLKRCLTKSTTVIKPKSKPRPKTAAEKKQGSGYDFVGLAEFIETSKGEHECTVFHDSKKSSKTTKPISFNGKIKVESDRSDKKLRDAKMGQRTDIRDRRKERQSSREESSSCFRKTLNNRGKMKFVGNESAGQKWKDGSNKLEKSSGNHSTNDRVEEVERCKSLSMMKSYKIPKIGQPRERNEDDKLVALMEDKRKSPSPVKMPVLEPQINMNFEITGSDRDTSRSPPVITKHEEPEMHNEIPKKMDDNLNLEKLDITKKEESEPVTFADIVSQLAYHEKVKYLLYLFSLGNCWKLFDEKLEICLILALERKSDVCLKWVGGKIKWRTADISEFRNFEYEKNES